MKTGVYAACVSLLVLTACLDGENPFMGPDLPDPVDPDPENPTNEAGIPERLARNLTAVNFDPGAGTLLVDMAALDRNDNDTPLEEYLPDPNLQAIAPAGYDVYSYQDDALDRMFVAIVAESPAGEVQGAIVMDGGQFTKFFGGGSYTRLQGYTPGAPGNDTGLVSYAGNYAGLSNLSAYGNELIPLPVGTDPAVRPYQPAQVNGEIFLNVDFGDNTINGAIYNRAFVNLEPALEAILGGSDLADIYLIPADVTTEGTFFGDAALVNQNVVGNFGGTFGGTEASAVAGTVVLDGDFIPGIDNEEEFGVFVLVQCGQPGDAAICSDTPVEPF